MDEQRERRRILFSGRVQGVGFRFRTLGIMRRHPAIKGFVRNLPDGRVELVLEGLKRETCEVLAEVEREMADYIESFDSTSHPATGEFDGFDIRY